MELAGKGVETGVERREQFSSRITRRRLLLKLTSTSSPP